MLAQAYKDMRKLPVWSSETDSLDAYPKVVPMQSEDRGLENEFGVFITHWIPLCMESAMAFQGVLLIAEADLSRSRSVSSNPW